MKARPAHTYHPQTEEPRPEPVDPRLARIVIAALVLVLVAILVGLAFLPDITPHFTQSVA